MNKLKDGHEYELYVLNIIKTKYNSCWLWKDIPDNILPQQFYKNKLICDDIGCDIIGINKDDTIDYIQCKNYSTTGNDNTINICDLAGFYNFIAENSVINAIVYYSGKLSQQILCRKNKIQYINLPIIKNNNILDFKPRDYQLEAYNKLKDYNRSILSMPCGTGKTFVSFLLSLDYKNIFILTPLISTTEQILNHYKNYYSKYDNINYVLINCKAERNVNNIKLTNKNIIASTYDSSDVILKILDKTNLEDNLIIIDEFHNLSTDMITNNKNNMNKILVSKNKIMYMSATPLNTTYTSMQPLDATNCKDIFGENKYELSWTDAIKNNYICDYNFYYPDNNKIIEKIDNLKVDIKLIEKTILINKAYFLLECIKLTGIKKCITYLKTIEESTEFMKILQTINLYFELNIKVYEINYNTSNKKRTEYLNKFKNDKSINILCNVHILDEGIDIPICDSVYLTHPNNNLINIIQRISRANRLDKNNPQKIAKIFIWSKDKIKLEIIMNNISKTIINIKYGNEKSDVINNKIIIDKHKITNNNVINDTINDTINKKDLINYYKSFQKNIDNNFIEFIDEFYDFYNKDVNSINIDNIDVSNNRFEIDSNKVINYLKIKYARTFHENLRENYVLNTDYVMYRFRQKSEKNKQDVFYKLSFDGFEKICNASRSENSKQVRNYFILLRKFVNHYKQKINTEAVQKSSK